MATNHEEEARIAIFQATGMTPIDFRAEYGTWLPDGMRPFQALGHGPFTLERVEQVDDRNFLMHLRHEDGTPETVGYHRPADFYGMQHLAGTLRCQIGKRFALSV